MILAFSLSDIVTVPFGWILAQLYKLTSNYGVSMILFAVIVQSVMLPMTIKSKKSMMKMSRLAPAQQAIQRKYENDPQKQNEAIQKLYQDEGVSMGGGCLWSLIPMLILFPLFAVIRQPITYILGESAETAAQIVEIIQGLAPDLFSGNTYYAQVTAAQAIPLYAAEIQAAIPDISAATLQGINFNFLGINLGDIPSFSFWNWDSVSWAKIGAFLIPMISAAFQVLQMWISQKTNDSVVTNEKGVQDKETAKNSQSAQTTKTMMWMMPLLSLYIGFTVAAGLSLYWFVGNVYRMITDPIITKHYRKIYDAEDAVRLQKAMEEDRIEAEKERIRAQRRAENPDGITENTSKKKMQKQQKAAQEAERAAAAKEYAAKKGVSQTDEDMKNVMSGISGRPYCKGRNYDPNRYGIPTEE